MEISIITSNISADFLNPPGVPSWDERKQKYIDVLLKPIQILSVYKKLLQNNFCS